MRSLLIYVLSSSLLCPVVLADAPDRSCAALGLSAKDFDAALGSLASSFIPAATEKACAYRNPGGSAIKMMIESSGQFAIDEFNSKRDADAEKAKLARQDIVLGPPEPKPQDIPNLGSIAYAIGNRSRSVVHFMDFSKTNYISVEVTLKERRLSADETARKIAQAIARTLPSPEDPATQAVKSASSECGKWLSTAEIERITRLPAGGYTFTQGLDGSCQYTIQKQGDAQRSLMFLPVQLKSRAQANTMLNDLQSRSIKARQITNIGALSGFLPAGLLWFVSSNKRWIVMVGYHELNAPNATPADMAYPQQDQIRNALARAIDANLTQAYTSQSDK